MTNDIQNDIHDDILKRFKLLSEKDLLAHAYLFIGPAEIGKLQTALAVAKFLNCENKGASFCNECASCRKINQQSHPDVFVVQRQEDATLIKIHQVRDILAQVRLMPFEAKKKVFIIKNIEALNAEGANALLKTLEEPTSSSLLILTCAALDNVLPTVISRCHQIQFHPQSNEQIVQQLEGEFVESFQSAHYLAYFSEGCLNKAKRLREEEFFDIKNDYLDEFLFQNESEEFIKKIIAEREQTKDFLRIILSWIRDCMLLKSGVDDARLINLDRKFDLEDYHTRFSFEDLNSMYKQCVNAYKQVMDNLNVKMSLMILKAAVTA